MMTKKHFVALAAINKARVEHYSTAPEDRVGLYTLIFEQAQFFAAHNPRFNMEKFMEASGFKNSPDTD